MIVVLHPSDELYGADRVLLETISALSLRDDVQVWLPTDVAYPEQALSRQLELMGVEYRHTPLPVLRRANANAKGVLGVMHESVPLLKSLQHARPDALYVNTSALAPAVPLGAILRIPTTLHIHETWKPIDRRLLTHLCSPADTVIVVGEATRQALPRSLRQRAVIRRHSVSAPPPDPMEIERIQKLTDTEAPVVLYAGRWTPGKGVRELLDALVPTTTHLLVLGAPPPSGEGIDMPAEVARRGLQERVTIVGEVADVWPYIYASDAVAIPSVAPESYPTIALEAIAAGRPVLASDIGGLPEIVGPGSGWLLPAGDLPAWSARLGSLEPAADLQQ